jgi:peptidase M28-like protein
LKHRTFPLLVACLAVPGVALAQTSPFVPDPVFRRLVNEISGDRAYEDIRHLTHFHRTEGSRDFFAAAEWIRGAAEAAGLEDVKLIRQKWSGRGWSCTFGEAWIVEPEETKLAAYSDVAVSIADNSRTTHVVADLVDVGVGTGEADYKTKEVRGKIVLAEGAVAKVQEEAVWRRGALGVLSADSSRSDRLDAPDQVAWGRLPYESKEVAGVKDGTPSAFAVMISPRRARALRARLAASDKPFKLKVDIESSYPAEQEQALVEAWIHGSEVHDQQIVLTSHIQEEKTSANDDGSGCASMLEIGRSLVRLMKDGKLPRPRRDIRFWWANELASEPQYFRENPKEPRRMLLDIQQDMVGARQSWGGRVQYASRSPWSLPHALDDVMESVLGMVRDGNTELLTTRGTKVPVPFSREIVAVKGTREPFHARMVPYFGHSDHHAFTPAYIGVPATALINWPDEYIHSTGDDLENVDATQLERNAVVVAAVALFFAGADDTDAATLASTVAARARERVAADVATAVADVASSAPNDRDRAYRDARNLVHQSHFKEMGALASVRRLAPKGRAADIIAQASSRLEGSEGADFDLVERAYMGITGKNPPNLDLSKDEKAMAGQVFTPIADIGALHDALAAVKRVEGLHPVMQFEAFNFADGKRNALEIYEAVAAEALSAGAWYFGTVSPADVLEALNRGVKSGAFTVKSQ